MSDRSILDRILDSIFPSPKSEKHHTRKRKLGLESLEAREMLSANPLSSIDPQDDPSVIVQNQSAAQTSLPPSNLKAAGGRESTIMVTWDASPDAASYRIQRSTDAVNWTTVSNTSALQFEDWNLLVDTEYYYRAASVSADGTVSDWSDIVTGRRRTVVGMPVIESTCRTDKSFVLEWDAVDNAINYRIDISKDDGKTWLWQAGTPATTYVYAQSSYSPDAEIRFRVMADSVETGYGVSGWSNVVSNFDPYEIEPSIPARPSGVTATALNSSEIKITWNSSVKADSYKLEWSESPDGSWSTLYEGTTATFTHDNLDANSYRYYRVTAINEIGESNISYVVSARPFDPPTDPLTPTGLKAEGYSDRGVKVAWNAVPGAASYVIQWSKNGTTWEERTTAVASYQYLNGDEGVEYFFRVMSIDSSGNRSEYSPVVSGRRPVVLSSSTPRVAERTDKAIVLEWDAVENASTYTVQVSQDGGTTWKDIILSTAATTGVYGISADPGAEYLFRARIWTAESGYAWYSGFGAVCVSDIPYAASQSVPGRVSNVQASATSWDKIAVSWNASPGATSYRVETSTSKNGAWSTAYEGASNSFSHTNLVGESVHYYRVTAINARGESQTSYNVSAVTPKRTFVPGELPAVDLKTRAFQAFSGRMYSVTDTSKGLVGEREDGVQGKAVFVQGAANGSFLLREDGTFDYRSSTGFVGTDSFQYKIAWEDGTESEVRTMLIAVVPVWGGEIIAGSGIAHVGTAMAFDYINSENAGAFIPATIDTYSTVGTQTNSSPKTLENEDGTSVAGNRTKTVTTITMGVRTTDGWYYTEIVSTDWSENYAEAAYTGSSDYVFSYWTLADKEGFVYNASSSDRFDISSGASAASAATYGFTQPEGMSTFGTTTSDGLAVSVTGSNTITLPIGLVEQIRFPDVI